MCSSSPYGVVQRTHEIGLRIALGAEERQILFLVLRQGVGLAVLGCLVGLLGAFGLTRLLSGLLYGVSSTDPSVFAAIAVLLIVGSAIATYVPARRAMRVDPVTALRAE